MRIGAPARKYGVADADIEYAARHALRRVALDEDLTMFIGPARVVVCSKSAFSIVTAMTLRIHVMGLRATFPRCL